MAHFAYQGQPPAAAQRHYYSVVDMTETDRQVGPALDGNYVRVVGAAAAAAGVLLVLSVAPAVQQSQLYQAPVSRAQPPTPSHVLHTSRGAYAPGPMGAGAGSSFGLEHPRAGSWRSGKRSQYMSPLGDSAKALDGGAAAIAKDLPEADFAEVVEEKKEKNEKASAAGTSVVTVSLPPAAQAVAEKAKRNLPGVAKAVAVTVTVAALYFLGLVSFMTKLCIAGCNRVLHIMGATHAQRKASERAKVTPVGYKPNQSLQEHDPEMYELIEMESERQQRGLEMIASENFTSRAVMQCLGSCLTNKYAEGESGARYYGGNAVIDQVEDLCKERALKAFGLDPEVWAVNVQPYSGSPANFGVYTGLLQPQDRVMGLDLTDGGHLTHGYQTKSGKKISATSIYFESSPYNVDEDGFIDYDGLDAKSAAFKPKLLIAGCSAYPRELDYKRFRKAADNAGSILLADMAHVSGLVAAGEHNSPFEDCDVVTTTTHKSLRGPRSGMIFSRRVHKDGTPTGYPEAINQAIFPGLQGGPHEHQIAAVATQLKDVMSPEFKVYIKQVKANAVALADAMMNKGYKLMTNGTENHLILWDLRPCGLTGSKMEKLLEAVSISVNKNTLPGDKSAMSPSGIRIGVPALTTRGLQEADFVKIADFYEEAVGVAQRIQDQSGPKLKDFIEVMEGNAEVLELKARVEAYACQFPMPTPA